MFYLPVQLHGFKEMSLLALEEVIEAVIEALSIIDDCVPISASRSVFFSDLFSSTLGYVPFDCASNVSFKPLATELGI